MLIHELKEKCNKNYSSAIEEMEHDGNVSKVRESLLEAAQLLVEIGNEDISQKSECLKKARLLLTVAKSVIRNRDFDDAYFKLTGQFLIRQKGNCVISCGNDSVKGNKEGLQQSETKKSDYDSKPGCSCSGKTTEEKQRQNTAESSSSSFNGKIVFNWDEKPSITFSSVAGLEEVKETVKNKVILPLKFPDLFKGYTKKDGGGILLYGPPGTGKTMIAAAIANEIDAKFCSIGPSDLLTTGVGKSEKLIATLFKEARSFPCSVIFFDEFECLCPVRTHAQHARQIRSELLKQMQGLDSYKESGKQILLLIGATNKPWDIDPAFVRPGRLGTKIYVDLPNDEARRYMVETALSKIEQAGSVKISNCIDMKAIVEKTMGFNGADVANLIDTVQELSILRAQKTGVKEILKNDFDSAFVKITSSVQAEDIEKLIDWKNQNG